MEPVQGNGSTEQPGKDAVDTMNVDETVDSKYSKSSSSLSSYSSATCESSTQNVSPVQVPVTQVMERPGDVPSDRIPASIFENKTSNPTDWSAVSNDSLFSIQIGKLSFSRDQFLTLTEDKFDELFKSGEMRKSAEVIRSRLNNESSVGNQHSDMVKKYEVQDKALEESPNKNSDQLKHGVPCVDKTGGSSENHQQLDESGISGQPLGFPKKNKKSGCWGFCLCTWSFGCKWPSWKCCSMWPSCCCSWLTCGFKWASCGCKWPKCGCKWPSCGCNWPSCGCKWPSCGCNWPGCGCKWPSCSCCAWPSCSCCTWPSCSCCKWPKSCSCCEWPWSCCKFQCPSFNCNCSSFSWSCCCPCSSRKK